ncbi:MAG: LPXTG-motif cell wall anchor domain protein, partial [Thermomicrobiales bacterium]|nr:LPXTG-motif cell wall anchor domain protein [Thermomicrobiales bacterium]
GPRRVIVAVDDAGAVTTKDTLRDTTLTVAAVDANGAPRTGSCFALIDRDDQLRTQACDGDDGQADGFVELRVPNGLEDANYTLRETFTPEGSVPAEDQRLGLGVGRADATAPSAAGQTEEPTPEEPSAAEPGAEQPAGTEPAEPPASEPGDEPGRLTVVPVDDADQPLPGACYAIVEFNFELCDDDGDGSIVFDGVPPGPWTLRETVPPAGFTAVQDVPVTVEPTGTRVRVPHEAAQEVPAIQTAETPEAPAEIPPVTTDDQGQATIDLRDRDGNPVLGACWALTNRDTGESIQRCDGDDGAEDGTIDFGAVPAGRYRIEEVQTPAGLRPAEGQNVEVTAGAATDVTVEYRPAQAQPGRLILVVADENGAPIPETCFDLRGPVELTDVCDRQNDGRLNVPDIPPGEYTVTQTQTAAGFALAPETTVDVPEGETVELPVVNAPAEQAPEPTMEPTPESTPEPTSAPDEGPQVVPTEESRVIVTIQGEDGAPLPGACVELDDGVSIVSVCDDAERDASPQPGQIEIAALAPGAYFLSVTPPDGFDAPAPTAIELTAGQLTPFEIVLTPSAPGTGSIAIVAEDDTGDRLPAACYTLEIPPGGQTFGPFCDDDGDGVVTIQGITPGPLAVNQTTPPADTAAADPARQEVAIAAGEELRAVFLHGAPQEQEQEQAQTGIVDVRIVDAQGQPVAGCVDVFNETSESIACDNGEDDADDQPGQVRLESVPAGTYTVELFDLPEESEVPEVQTIDVRAGETTAVEFVIAAPETESEQPGSVEVRIADAAGQPVDACIDLFQGEGDGLIACDNEADDGDDRPGVIRLDAVVPGAYTLEVFDLPAGFVAPEPVPVTVESGETVAVDLPLTAQNGTLVILVEDENDQLVGESCFTLQSDALTLEDICDQGDDGRLSFPDLPPGDYMVTQTQAGEDRQLAPAQTVTVPPGQTVEVTVGNPAAPQTPTPTPEPTATPEPEATETPEPAETPEPTPEVIATVEQEQPATPGVLSVRNLDPDGNRLGAGCFVVADAAGTPVAERCDNEPGDLDNTPGVIQFGALPPGAYTVTQTRAAEGFAPAAPVQFEHGADAQSVEVVSEPAVPETGVVEFQTFDDAGNPVTDQCYTLAGLAGTFGPFCDNGEGDTSGEPGLLVVQGLPAGTYEAVLETAVTEPDAEQPQVARQRRSVSIRGGNRPTRAEFRVRAQQNQRGSLLIRVRDQDGDYLVGACFSLIADGETEPTIEVCDNRNGDENSSDGRILITRLRDGRYTLTQTEAPNGFETAPDQSVRVAAGDVREVSVTNRAAPDDTASLDVETVNPEGDLLPGACYALLRGNTTAEACDEDGGEEGITLFTDLEAGSYLVRQIAPPDGGFAEAGDTAIRLDPGESATVTVTNEARPGSLTIRKTDDADQLLGGACFALISEGRVVYSFCDNDASDANRGAGTIVLGTVAPGDYILRETQPPVGFLAAADQDVTINANQRTQVTVVNEPAPEPEVTGDLRVRKIDTQGSTLAGSCFTLIDSGGNALVPRCDADDGADDGTILLAGVEPGSYTLRETRRPSADYETAADVAVEIVANRTVDVEVENRLLTGRILIRKFDPNGVPLADACFEIVDTASEACTDENGQLVFSGLAPSVYRVVETEAPPGFLGGPALDPVTVRPGSTTTVDVVNQPEPPAPDSGSIQVRKFVCPVEPGGGGIDFVDSSDPDGGGLARTAGCNPGDAAFSLDGPSGPIEFRTGTSGHFQTTLESGDYVLTELATGATEALVVSVNTLTTVVVINYVEPETPAPAAVDVLKYTCAPGFQGSVWLDFAEGCLFDQNLTSNVGFRISGAVSARRVTGDAGFAGQTRFDNLLPGDYRLSEETPLGVVAVYAFCGLDPAAPDGRAVGDSVGLRLGAGQNVTCYFFNVPEDLTGSTGAVTVYKYACPITTPPATYDWFGRCNPQGSGVRFSLTILDGDRFVPVVTGATDGDGILRFTRLQPGTYELTEVDATWCHAESDSVTSQGNLIVEAGERASVWIFNCVGAKNPPNTGAGPMWSGPATAALPGLSSIGFGLLWPALGVLGLRLRRRK